MELALGSTLDIGHGVRMPRLGLGTYKTRPGSEVAHSVESALRYGYRCVDTASMYENEEGVGEGVRASGVPREEVFISTKVWNDEQGYEGTIAALDRSLQRLDTDYVDLYLVHWPIRPQMEGTWRAMEELQASGKARAIGVCNHLPHHLDVLMKLAEKAPLVDQVEFHPWLQQPSLQAYLAEHDIALQAWAPVMRGRADEVEELVEIGRTHGVSASQVSIRWILQQGYLTIPKSVHEERIAENCDVFGFALTDEEMNRIGAVDQGLRLGRDPDSWDW